MQATGALPKGDWREMTDGFQCEKSFQFTPRALALRAMVLGSLNSISSHCELSAKIIIKASLQIPTFSLLQTALGQPTHSSSRDEIQHLRNSIAFTLESKKHCYF